MTNLAVVAHAADDLRIDEIGEPTPDADEAVVAVAYGGRSAEVDGIVTHVEPVANALAAFSTAGDASRSSKVVLSFGAEG